MFGYYRLASAVPQLRVADVDYNVDQLMDLSLIHISEPTRP